MALGFSSFFLLPQHRLRNRVNSSLLVRQQLVEAAVEHVLLDDSVIPAQQISHGAVLEPVPMQPPLAARVAQAIANQGLQKVAPAGSFARVRQPRGPEIIETQLRV